MACTSKPREWGKGTVKRDPGQLIDKDYYSRDFKKRALFDPRPTAHQVEGPLSSDFLNSFHASLQSTEVDSVFMKHIPLTYSDFNLEEEDIALLLKKIRQFYAGWCKFVGTSSDPILIPGTERQSESDLWKMMRCLIFTASVAKQVVKIASEESMKTYLRSHLWNMDEEVITVAIKWGMDHEKDARDEYIEWKTETSGCIVTVEQTGLLVKRDFPFLGCSPDGIVTEGNLTPYLLEIKCPYTLRNHHPKDFAKVLTPQQLKNFAIGVDDDGAMYLKDDHKWYYQIQMGMDVCKVETCDFFMWSPKGHITLSVPYKPEFWLPHRNTLIERHGGFLVPEYILQRVPRNLNPIYFNYSNDEEDELADSFESSGAEKEV